MKRLPLLIGLLLLAAASLHADEATLRKLDHEMTVATWTGDTRWFEENLADDFVLISAAGRVKSRGEAIAELSSPGFRMEPYESSEVQVRVYGDTGVVTTRIYQRYILHGYQYEADMRVTCVYVKRKGRWLVASEHASPVMVKGKKH